MKKVYYSQRYIDELKHDLNYNGFFTMSAWTKNMFKERISAKYDEETAKELLKYKVSALQSLLISDGFYPVSIYGKKACFYKLPKVVKINDLEKVKRINDIPSSGRFLCEYLYWENYDLNKIPERRRGVAIIKNQKAYFENGDIKNIDSKGFKVLKKITER